MGLPPKLSPLDEGEKKKKEEERAQDTFGVTSSNFSSGRQSVSHSHPRKHFIIFTCKRFKTP
jgi:hypothetical protein